MRKLRGALCMPVFVALEISDPRLPLAAQPLTKYGYKVVDKDHLHLTLLFLGDHSGYHLHRILETLRDVHLSLPSRLRVEGLTLLPPGKGTNVAILLRRDPLLYEARRELVITLKGVVELRDRYEFLPHVTIARRLRPLDPATEANTLKTMERVRRLLPRTLAPTRLSVLRTVRGGGYERLMTLKASWVRRCTS